MDRSAAKQGRALSPIEIVKRMLSKHKDFTNAVLINVPQVPLESLEYEVARGRGYFAYPPQGLLYLASKLDDLKVENKVIDLNYWLLKEAQARDGLKDEDWLKHIDDGKNKKNKPVFLISLMFHATYPAFEKVSRYIRAKHPDAAIFVGGVNATADAEQILSNNLADFVVSNEGEGPLEAIVKFLRGEESTEIFNVSAVNDSVMLSTEMRNGGEVNYDVSAQYAKIPIADYHNVGSLNVYSRMVGVDKVFATMISKRGCRAHCTFCGVRNFNGRGVRLRDVDAVVDEMKLLHEKYNVRHFDWLDDDLLFDREPTVKMFQRIAKELPNVTWSANNGLIPAALNPEFLDAMKASHCVGFKIGVESGNREMLKQVNKPITLRKLYEFSRMIKDYPSMFVSTNMILGLPQETFAQMLDSFFLNNKLGLDWTNFYIYQPLKNTEAYKAFGGLSDQGIELTHGKDNVGPNAPKEQKKGNLFNPARGRNFLQLVNPDTLKSGYDIFNHAPGHIPTRLELSEIWFTFNVITNFLRVESLQTEQDERRENAISFLRVLAPAYPSDPSMKLLLAHLLKQAKSPNKKEIEALQDAAKAILKSSDYWKVRDKQFDLSAFLKGKVPEVPKELEEKIQEYKIEF